MRDRSGPRRSGRRSVKYRHQTAPPNEYLAADWEAHDPVKIFNVYGYCMCCCCSALVEALNRDDGREARGRILNGHSVPEVRYGDGWHMFDGSLITYFPRPDDGVVASVDEIAGGGRRLVRQAPRLPEERRQAHRADAQATAGRAGRPKGPSCWRNCPFYRPGLPPRPDARLGRDDGRVRPQERGLRVRLPGRPPRAVLAPAGRVVRPRGGQPRPARQHGRPTRAGTASRPGAPRTTWSTSRSSSPAIAAAWSANGIHRYAPNLAAGDLAAGAEVFENLAPAAARRRCASRPRAGRAWRSIPMISPYVYLGGRAHGSRPCGQSDGDQRDRLDLDQQRPDVHAALVDRADRRRSRRRST